MTRINVHPSIRTGLGLASNSFLPALQHGEITLEKLFQWAAEKGFSWIELRDPNVEMDVETLNSLKKLADRLQIKVHYAWNNPNLTQKEESFLLGIKNASIFGQGTCCRVVLAPSAVRGKDGYDAQDFQTICSNAAEYGKIAAEKGIRLCFENSMEPILEMEKILQQCTGIYTTLDAANFTTDTTAVNPGQTELLEYIRSNREKIPYFHLKVTREHKVLSSIEPKGDFDVFAILEELAKNPETLICLELPSQEHLDDVQGQIEKSLQVLQRGRK